MLYQEGRAVLAWIYRSFTSVLNMFSYAVRRFLMWASKPKCCAHGAVYENILGTCERNSKSKRGLRPPSSLKISVCAALRAPILLHACDCDTPFTDQSAQEGGREGTGHPRTKVTTYTGCGQCSLRTAGFGRLLFYHASKLGFNSSH